MLSLALSLALTLAINASLSANLSTSLSLSDSVFKAVDYHVSSVDISTPVKDTNPSPSRGSGRRE